MKAKPRRPDKDGSSLDCTEHSVAVVDVNSDVHERSPEMENTVEYNNSVFKKRSSNVEIVNNDSLRDCIGVENQLKTTSEGRTQMIGSVSEEDCCSVTSQLINSYSTVSNNEDEITSSVKSHNCRHCKGQGQGPCQGQGQGQGPCQGQGHCQARGKMFSQLTESNTSECSKLSDDRFRPTLTTGNDVISGLPTIQSVKERFEARGVDGCLTLAGDQDVHSSRISSSVPNDQSNSHVTDGQSGCRGSTQSVGVSTDPECLGPCDPGSSVFLEGIVWKESSNGLLVVNVTWRGKTYVGTLMDATNHNWASPCFSDESVLMSDQEDAIDEGIVVKTPPLKRRRSKRRTSVPFQFESLTSGWSTSRSLGTKSRPGKSIRSTSTFRNSKVRSSSSAVPFPTANKFCSPTPVASTNGICNDAKRKFQMSDEMSTSILKKCGNSYWNNFDVQKDLKISRNETSNGDNIARRLPEKSGQSKNEAKQVRIPLKRSASWNGRSSERQKHEEPLLVVDGLAPVASNWKLKMAKNDTGSSIEGADNVWKGDSLRLDEAKNGMCEELSTSTVDYQCVWSDSKSTANDKILMRKVSQDFPTKVNSPAVKVEPGHNIIVTEDTSKRNCLISLKESPVSRRLCKRETDGETEVTIDEVSGGKKCRVSKKKKNDSYSSQPAKSSSQTLSVTLNRLVPNQLVERKN